MNSREAIKSLEKAGFTGRNGNGSHYVMTKGTKTIVISMGQTELSNGIAGKVRSILNNVPRGTKGTK